MNKYLNKIANLHISQRIGLAVVLILLMFGGFWQFIYTDLNIKTSELELELENLENKIIQERKVSRNLEKFQVETKEQEELFANVLRELPDRKEIDGFLRSISVLATDTGLEVLEFTPLPEEKLEYLANLPVDMKLEGSFHQLLTFFDEVAHLPRIVNIDKINLRVLSLTAEEMILQFTCQATTFRYLDESERPIEGEGEDQAKRRRR